MPARKESMTKYPQIREPQKWIEACRETIRHYEQGIYFAVCKLCIVESLANPDPMSDCYCPWTLFGWKGNKYCQNSFDGTYTKAENIKRLKHWIKIIQRQIDSNKF